MPDKDTGGASSRTHEGFILRQAGVLNRWTKRWAMFNQVTKKLVWYGPQKSSDQRKGTGKTRYMQVSYVTADVKAPGKLGLLVFDDLNLAHRFRALSQLDYNGWRAAFDKAGILEVVHRATPAGASDSKEDNAENSDVEEGAGHVEISENLREVMCGPNDAVAFCHFLSVRGGDTDSGTMRLLYFLAVVLMTDAKGGDDPLPAEFNTHHFNQEQLAEIKQTFLVVTAPYPLRGSVPPTVMHQASVAAALTYAARQVGEAVLEWETDVLPVDFARNWGKAINMMQAMVDELPPPPKSFRRRQSSAFMDDSASVLSTSSSFRSAPDPWLDSASVVDGGSVLGYGAGTDATHEDLLGTSPSFRRGSGLRTLGSSPLAQGSGAGLGIASTIGGSVVVAPQEPEPAHQLEPEPEPEPEPEHQSTPEQKPEAGPTPEPEPEQQPQPRPESPPGRPVEAAPAKLAKARAENTAAPSQHSPPTRTAGPHTDSGAAARPTSAPVASTTSLPQVEPRPTKVMASRSARSPRASLEKHAHRNARQASGGSSSRALAKETAQPATSRNGSAAPREVLPQSAFLHGLAQNTSIAPGCLTGKVWYRQLQSRTAPDTVHATGTPASSRGWSGCTLFMLPGHVLLFHNKPQSAASVSASGPSGVTVLALAGAMVSVVGSSGAATTASSSRIRLEVLSWAHNAGSSTGRASFELAADSPQEFGQWLQAIETAVAASSMDACGRLSRGGVAEVVPLRQSVTPAGLRSRGLSSAPPAGPADSADAAPVAKVGPWSQSVLHLYRFAAEPSPLAASVHFTRCQITLAAAVFSLAALLSWLRAPTVWLLALPILASVLLSYAATAMLTGQTSQVRVLQAQLASAYFALAALAASLLGATLPGAWRGLLAALLWLLAMGGAVGGAVYFSSSLSLASRAVVDEARDRSSSVSQRDAPPGPHRQLRAYASTGWLNAVVRQTWADSRGLWERRLAQALQQAISCSQPWFVDGVEVVKVQLGSSPFVVTGVRECWSGGELELECGIQFSGAADCHCDIQLSLPGQAAGVGVRLADVQAEMQVMIPAQHAFALFQGHLESFHLAGEPSVQYQLKPRGPGLRLLPVSWLLSRWLATTVGPALWRQ